VSPSVLRTCIHRGESFGCAHTGKVCVCIFISVSVRACCGRVILKKQKPTVRHAFLFLIDFILESLSQMFFLSLFLK
jgi:hypothetical protein